MQDYFNTPIFVLGLPRSGTSMVSGSLGICGAWTGSTVPGHPLNPKGAFEHIVIREHITKKMLALLGCDPLGVRKLPPVDIPQEVPNLAGVLREILEKDGYKHDKPWLLKDPKLTLVWPVYKKAFPKARWLVVTRDEEGFINSCLRADFMQQHSQDRDYWKRFAHEYRIRINALKSSVPNVLEIYSPDVIGGNLEQLRAVVTQLGLTFQEAELKEFISPAYWHGNAGEAVNSDS